MSVNNNSGRILVEFEEPVASRVYLGVIDQAIVGDPIVRGLMEVSQQFGSAQISLVPFGSRNQSDGVSTRHLSIDIALTEGAALQEFAERLHMPGVKQAFVCTR